MPSVTSKDPGCIHLGMDTSIDAIVVGILAPDDQTRALSHPGGSQAWSIQQIAEHMSPTLSNTPNHACPANTFPAARTSPWAGKYIDM